MQSLMAPLKMHWVQQHSRSAHLSSVNLPSRTPLSTAHLAANLTLMPTERNWAVFLGSFTLFMLYARATPSIRDPLQSLVTASQQSITSQSSTTQARAHHTTTLSLISDISSAHPQSHGRSNTSADIRMITVLMASLIDGDS